MNPTEKPGKLNFTPVSEGLGFHPFSDGLPYAPVGKNTKVPAPSAPSTVGTGAIAAGPATFVFPKAPLISPPIAPSPSPSAIPSQPIKQPVLSKPAEPEAPLAQSQLLEDQPGIVYLLKRVFAWSVDLSLNGIFIAAGWLAALWDQVQEWDFFLQLDQLRTIALIFTVFQWGLITAQEIAFQTTFGKRLFGLKVEGSPGARLIRSLLFFPSLLLSGVGILWALFDSKKRCWHDRASGTRVIEIARL